MSIVSNVAGVGAIADFIMATGEFSTVFEAVQAGVITEAGTGIFVVIEGGAGTAISTVTGTALEVAAQAGLAASPTQVGTAGITLAQTQTGFVPVAMGSMSLSAAAAAAAPFAGIAIGANLYQENPEFWTTLSQKLLPFCYPGTDRVPTWAEVVQSTGAWKLLIAAGIIDAIKSACEEADVHVYPRYYKTNGSVSLVGDSSERILREIWEKMFTEKIDTITGTPGPSYGDATGNDCYTPNAIIARSRLHTMTLSGWVSNLRGLGIAIATNNYADSVIKQLADSEAYPTFEEEHTPGLYKWDGVEAPTVPEVVPIIVVPEPVGPDYQPITVPTIPITPIPLPPHIDPLPLPAPAPDPEIEPPPENWPEEEPWPTTVPFPWPAPDETPDPDEWPEIMPWPLPSNPPEQWPATPEIPTEWPEPFPSTEPWPHFPEQWPEEVPWPENPPYDWPEEIPWPTGPDQWPEEIPWPVPWPDDWPTYPPSWPETYPTEIPWPSSPEDWPAEVPWPETAPDWWPGTTPWPTSPDDWPDEMPWPMPPSWPIPWPNELPYPIPWPWPEPTPEPRPNTEPGRITDPDTEVQPYIDPIPWPYNPTNTDPEPQPEDPTQPTPIPDPSRDPSQPEPTTDPQPTPEPIPDPMQPTPPPSSGDITPPTLPYVPLPFSPSTGLITVYHPDQSTLLAFCNWLWVTWEDATIDKIWNNPFDGVITLFELYCTPTDVGSKTIRSGFLDSLIASPYISRYTEINCGTLGIPEYYGNYLDYAPYTKAYIYLPFIGVVELNADDIVGHGVNVTYKIDEYNGSCIAMITVAKVTEVNGEEVEYNNVFYQYSGNCAVELPIAGGSQASIKAGLLEAAAWGLGSVISGVITGGMGGGLGIGQSIGNNMAQGAASAVHSVVSAKSSVQHSGSFGSSYGALGAKKPFITVVRPKQIQIANYNELYGYQAHKAVRIGNCTGYLRCREVHVISPTASDDEKAKIEELLKMGVYVTE